MTMSLRSVVSRVWTHGRAILRGCRQDYHWRSKIFAQNLRTESRSSPSSGVQKHYDNARRIFANNILRRVTNPVSSDLRKRTTQQLLYGNSTPFFAFVGISLASGSIISKEDELEGLCWEIREAVERMQDSLFEAESDLFNPNEVIDLKKFAIGPFIKTGSNAAVYAASKSSTKDNDNVEQPAVTFDTKSHISGFPFALKMMFNFDIESNATSILRAMLRETIPARFRFVSNEFAPWMQSMYENLTILPPHPNVVMMHCAFVDYVPELPSSRHEFPAALPPRINPTGFGRNKTLFLLMKRYDTTLKEYLEEHKVEGREAILIVAQILEAVVHINRNGIAHRDLKSDNILMEFGEDGYPNIALTDFGCALAEKNSGLVIPFRSYDTNRGGNAALMAPEVACAQPSLLSGIDYSKSDGWAVGAMIAEILLGWNPFYRCINNPDPLFSTTYKESDLPDVPGPPILSALYKSLLTVKPSQRPSAEFAANVLQLYLWSPSDWLKSVNPPSNTEIMQWLLCLTTKVLTTSSFGQRRSEVEYRLIGSFLSRLKLSSLKDALFWLRSLQ